MDPYVILEPRRPMRKGLIAGCVGIVLFCGFLGFIFWLVIFSNTCARMLGTETYPLVGDPKHFDPFAELPNIRQRVGKGAILRKIEVDYVRSDGTMDLLATYKPAPKVEYEFLLPVKPPSGDSPPIGAGRTESDVWLEDVTVEVYEPGQVRFVTKMSGGSTSKYQYHNEGMDIDRGAPRMQQSKSDIGDPKITLKSIWDRAIQKGANPRAVATIDYDEDGYEFEIKGWKVGLKLDSANVVLDR